MCFTPQNICEFWSVATRHADSHGLGFSASFSLSAIGEIEQTLTLLPELPGLYAEWKRLVSAHNVQGKRAHDARLVAAMNLHGVARILTFNVADVARCPIEALNPSVLVTD